MRRIAAISVVVSALAGGPATAQGVEQAAARIAALLIEECIAMAEPLDAAAERCTEAIKSGRLSEAQIGEVLRARGVIAYRQQRYDAAMQDLNLSIQYAPEAGRTYYFKGLVYEATGEDRRADGQYRNARLYAPEDPDIVAKIRERNLN